MEYFKNPGAVNKEKLGEIYENAKKEGASLFSKESFDRFRSKGTVDEEAPKKAAKKKKAAAPKAAPAKSRVAKIVEDEFAARLGKHPSVRKAINGKIHLDVTGDGGGQWTLARTGQ